MSKTVLTIDDSRTMRDMLLMALEDAGYVVIQAVDGVDGLETLAAQGADDSFAYLGVGPFASQDAMRRQIADMGSMADYMYWAIRPVATGVASGWLALLDMQPKHASIELGGIWFSPRMQRTRAATLPRHGADPRLPLGRPK